MLHALPIMQHALKFGGATSDRADNACNPLDDLARVSVLVLLKPTTFTTTRTIISKGSTTVGWALGLSGSVGQISFAWQRATTDTQYTTFASALKLNNWTWLAVMADTALGTGLKVKFWTAPFASGGALTNNATSTDIEGAGANSSDAAVTFDLGNTSGNAVAFQGSIAFAAVYGGALLTQHDFQQMITARDFAPSRAAGMWLPGADGIGQANIVRDLTGRGNHLSITGATLDQGPNNSVVSSILPRTWLDAPTAFLPPVSRTIYRPALVRAAYW